MDKPTKSETTYYRDLSKRLKKLRESYIELRKNNIENMPKMKGMRNEIYDIDAKLKAMDARLGTSTRHNPYYNG